MIEIKRYCHFWLFVNIFLQIIKSYNMIDCDNRAIPFEKGGNCVEICTTEEINTGTCKIQNEIIKVQWLNNNILYLGPPGNKYINIAVTENNKLCGMTSGYPENNTRYVFILGEDGNGFFSTNENTKTPYSTTNTYDSETKGRFESTLFTIKLYSITDYRDYLITIPKADQKVEIYDFYSGNIYMKYITNIFGQLCDVFAYSIAHLKLLSNENTNIYLIGLLATEYPAQDVQDRYFYLRKVKFNTLDIGTTNPEYSEQKVLCSYTAIVSCYQDSNTYIVCFFKNSTNKYIMIVYSENLVE